MSVDEALDLLGETADGFGPEADRAWDLVRADIDRMRIALKTIKLIAKDQENWPVLNEAELALAATESEGGGS
jgi:hypothetical protein